MLCEEEGGTVLWRDDFCRIVRIPGADYPGFCRVILKRHAREMTDLDEAERAGLMAVVYAVEDAIRATMRPDKMNLASLGNMTPHVHWHVVPRWNGDTNFMPVVGETRVLPESLEDTARKLRPRFAS